MATETFDEYMARDGHRYDYAPQAAEMAWEAAIKSMEGVQNQTNNSRIMPCLYEPCKFNENTKAAGCSTRIKCAILARFCTAFGRHNLKGDKNGWYAIGQRL